VLSTGDFWPPKGPVNIGFCEAKRLADIFVGLIVKNFLKGNATPDTELYVRDLDPLIEKIKRFVKGGRA
jgi:hypothetical protein